MAPDAVERIATKAEAARLAIGTGRDGPDPTRGAPRAIPDLDGRGASPLRPNPHGRPTGRRRSTAGPDRPGTTSSRSSSRRARRAQPKGVMLTHGNIIGVGRRRLTGSSPPQEHRVVSLLPLSHLLEQVDGALLRADRRRRHPLRPQPQPARDLRGDPRASGDDDGRRAPGARPVLDRDRARGRQVGSQRGVRPAAAHRPTPAVPVAADPVPARPRPARRRSEPVRVCRRVPAAGAAAGLGGPGRRRDAGLRSDRVRPRVRDHEAGPRPGHGRQADPGLRGQALARRRDPDAGTVALPGLLARPGGDGRRADGRRLVSHRRHRPVRRRRASDPDGSDEGHHRAAERPERVPEDIENALRMAGIRDSVVLETQPGRIEAIVLASTGPIAAGRRPPRTARSTWPTRTPSAHGSTRR